MLSDSSAAFYHWSPIDVHLLTMGQTPKKYHVSDDGQIYRINKDGSFTNMGNIESIPAADISRRKQPFASSKATNAEPEQIRTLSECIELLYKGQGKSLSNTERMEVAKYCNDPSTLLSLLESANVQTKLILIRRYESGEEGLVKVILKLKQSDLVSVQNALARCKRRLPGQYPKKTAGSPPPLLLLPFPTPPTIPVQAVSRT